MFDVGHFETARNRFAQSFGDDPFDGVVGIERRTDDGARKGGRTEFALFLFVALTGQRKFR